MFPVYILESSYSWKNETSFLSENNFHMINF